MISHTPQMALQDSTKKLDIAMIGRVCAYALFSVIVFGGWVATWTLILGLSLTIAILAPVGLAVFALVPASVRRSQQAKKARSSRRLEDSQVEFDDRVWLAQL